MYDAWPRPGGWLPLGCDSALIDEWVFDDSIAVLAVGSHRGLFVLYQVAQGMEVVPASSDAEFAMPEHLAEGCVSVIAQSVSQFFLHSDMQGVATAIAMSQQEFGFEQLSTGVAEALASSQTQLTLSAQSNGIAEVIGISQRGFAMSGTETGFVAVPAEANVRVARGMMVR